MQMEQFLVSPAQKRSVKPISRIVEVHNIRIDLIKNRPSSEPTPDVMRAARLQVVTWNRGLTRNGARAAISENDMNFYSFTIKSIRENFDHSERPAYVQVVAIDHQRKPDSTG